MPDQSSFFTNPILNSPYAAPTRHWELDDDNQPTGEVVNGRREASFITPVPVPRGTQRDGEQAGMVIDDPAGLSARDQQYTMDGINEVRRRVDRWRRLSNPNDWGVTYTTRLLLEHWRSDRFDRERPFFCQVEAMETIIWLTEVAPRIDQGASSVLSRLNNASVAANPGLLRWALKMATGAGKTTVMAMLIAWQTLNAIEHRGSNVFTRNFLVVTPGITIKNRLEVLLPNHPENYYANSQLVPPNLLNKLNEANIVITNYHAFQLRERLSLSKTQRDLLTGRGQQQPLTTETVGQMMQRVMPLLMDRRRGIMVLNDEGHHCYRRKPGEPDEAKLTGDERSEARSNDEAARVWISGLEAIQERIGINRVIDLSATPFFLRGSGYAEGTLFPWTVSDFALMDAIECGIVKLPRVPVVDNAETDTPVYRALWRHVGKDVRAATRGSIGTQDPEALPAQLKSAINALYSHYEGVNREWGRSGIEVPPCFIIVCNDTKTSKLVYDWVSGRRLEDDDGNLEAHFPAACRLFSNFDDGGAPLARPNTILIDSKQLESGEALSATFKRVASAEIEAFRHEVATVRGQGAADNITEQELLREVANSIGKPGRLGANIRCVVSVSMLTEGWDANTVTHILGVRAFGTQLLCEQVVGRALRRYSYELQDDGMFEAQYADVFGVPFDFTSKPVVCPPKPPKKTTRVRALRERSELEIRFPRVNGYFVKHDTRSRLTASFNEDSEYRLLAIDIPTETEVRGIAGESTVMTADDLMRVRPQEVQYHLANHLANTFWIRDLDDETPFDIRNFVALKRIVGQWIDKYVICPDNASLGLLMHHEFTVRACNKISGAILRTQTARGAGVVRPIIDRYSAPGSTRFVDATTTKQVFETRSDKCHVNYVVMDSGWEGEMARQIEQLPGVISYVKNHGLGLEIPYTIGDQRRNYLPDFIVRADVGADEPLNIIIEVKGMRGDDVAEKSTAARDYWVPSVNSLGEYGRWAFAYFDDPGVFGSGLERVIREHAGMVGA